MVLVLIEITELINQNGSSYEVNEILREWKGGRLKVSHEVHPHDGEFPPFEFELGKRAEEVLAMLNSDRHSDNEHMWGTGDVRANQHPLLFALHVLFLREHNRVAHILEHHNHHWDDQKIFDAARKYVIAEIQHVTYNEFLFWLLGRPFPEKDHYDPHCDPRVHDFFTTVAFRYGHSEVGNLIKKSTKGHFGDFPLWSYAQLHEHFFDPTFVLHADLGSLFEGLAYQEQKSPDAYFPLFSEISFSVESSHTTTSISFQLIFKEDETTAFLHTIMLELHTDLNQSTHGMNLMLLMNALDKTYTN